MVATSFRRGGIRDNVAKWKNFPPPLAALFCHTRHGVLALLRSSIPPFGLPPREEQRGSSLGGLGRGEVCLQGPARGVRLDNWATQPKQDAPGAWQHAAIHVKLFLPIPTTRYRLRGATAAAL